MAENDNNKINSNPFNFWDKPGEEIYGKITAEEFDKKVEDCIDISKYLDWNNCTIFVPDK